MKREFSRQRFHCNRSLKEDFFIRIDNASAIISLICGTVSSERKMKLGYKMEQYPPLLSDNAHTRRYNYVIYMKFYSKKKSFILNP